jgi:group I intron endonuclease
MATSQYTPKSGIYIIANTKNGKVYIGKTAHGFNTRYKKHTRALKGNYHNNRHLQAAWNKYGEKSFKFLVLEYCAIEQLNEREMHHIAIYKARGLAYNLTDGGDGGTGHVPTVETRAKMSAAGKGRKMPPFSAEHLANMSASRIGKKMPPFSAEHRAKISAANKGTKPAPQTIIAAIAFHAKTYIVTSPNGEEMTVTNLAKFCRENGLSNGNLANVITGKANHHKGWKCRHA